MDQEVGSSEAKPPSVLVVVLSLDREPWRTLEAAQSATWAQPQSRLEVLHLRGIKGGLPRAALLGTRKIAERLGRREGFDRALGKATAKLQVKSVSGVIQTQTIEYWIGTSAKTHACLKYLAARDLPFDYLVRTNSSTYIHVPRLLKHLESAPKHGYYAGANQGEAHAQGTLIVLSRDVVSALAEDSAWDYDLVDDVALGASTRRAGIALTPLNQVKLQSSDIRTNPGLDNPENFIFRFKNRADRLGDAALLEQIHELFGPHSITG